MNRIIISEKRLKKSVKTTQLKIKQTDFRPVFKEMVEEKRQTKKYSWAETLHWLGYSAKEKAQDSQVNMSLGQLRD